VQYAYQYNLRKEYDKTPPRSTNYVDVTKADLEYRITSQTIELVIEHLNIRSFRGQFGGSYMNQKNLYLGRFFIPNFLNNTWGAFATERYVKQHIELEAGVRYDYKNLRSFYYIGNNLQKPNLNFSNVSWNTGTILKPTTNLNFFINVGSAWRSPSPNELYSNGLHQGLGSIERGDTTLKTEQVYNITATGLYQNGNTTFEISAYHNQFTNFIYLNPDSQPELTIKGAFPVFHYKQANVRISGIDAKASTELFKHLQLTAKAMLLRAWNYTINDYLVYMPSDRYSLDIRAFTKVSKNVKDLYLQGGYQYVTKQWRVPDSTDFAPPPKAYGLLTAEIGTSLQFKRQVINISIAATNLLNAIYRDYLDRFRYFADSQGRNFTLRIKVPLVLYDKK
jgi:iron complex outermembrane receptor protein